MKVIVAILICVVLPQTIGANTERTEEQKAEIIAMVPELHHNTLAYRAAVTQKMVEEANYFANRLRLPTPHPIQMTDIQNQYTGMASIWYNILRNPVDHYPLTVFGTNIYDAKISREGRLRALKIGVGGIIETTNFEFVFHEGRLWEVTRLSEHMIERYAHDLDELVGKPSLINDTQAHELARQWLAAVDVDVTALDKEKWAVHQPRYLPRGATNPVTLPLYHVDFGVIHYTNGPENRPNFDEPMVSVEILGTTKELQDMTITDLSYSHRPLLLITNALDLARTPDPPMKQLAPPPPPPASPFSAAEKQERLSSLLELEKELEALPLGSTNPNETQKQDMLKGIANEKKQLESSTTAPTN